MRGVHRLVAQVVLGDPERPVAVLKLGARRLQPAVGQVLLGGAVQRQRAVVEDIGHLPHNVHRVPGHHVPGHAPQQLGAVFQLDGPVTVPRVALRRLRLPGGGQRQGAVLHRLPLGHRQRGGERLGLHLGVVREDGLVVVREPGALDQHAVVGEVHLLLQGHAEAVLVPVRHLEPARDPVPGRGLALHLLRGELRVEDHVRVPVEVDPDVDAPRRFGVRVKVELERPVEDRRHGEDGLPGAVEAQAGGVPHVEIVRELLLAHVVDVNARPEHMSWLAQARRAVHGHGGGVLEEVRALHVHVDRLGLHHRVGVRQLAVRAVEQVRPALGLDAARLVGAAREVHVQGLVVEEVGDVQLAQRRVVDHRPLRAQERLGGAVLQAQLAGGLVVGRELRALGVPGGVHQEEVVLEDVRHLPLHAHAVV